MLEKIIQLKGKKNGSASIILVGVQGNEKCDIGALIKNLPNLKIEKGQVFLAKPSYEDEDFYWIEKLYLSKKILILQICYS